MHTLSDITDGSGKYITRQSLQGHKDKERPLYHDWPEQQSPGTRQWRLWRKVIKLVFPLQENQLSSPLGAWIDNKADTWQWFYLPSTKQVFNRHGRRWKVYTRHFHNVQVKKGTLFKYDTDALLLPNSAQRATIIRQHNKIRLQGWNTDVSTTSFNIYNPTLSSNWIIKNSYQLHNEHRIATALKNNTVIAVSDGSYSP